MMTTRVAPFRLKPWFSERVWGRHDLRPWFADTGTTEAVGEAWLTGPESVAETGAFAGRTLESLATELGGEFPLLVKLLFPAEKLSVQVHPDDAQAMALGETRGKSECWYVLEAQPGAAVALGLKDGADAQTVKAAIADGTMESLLQQVPVSVGDMLFVEPGTVHAIGPGMVLLETQQTSDVTYRMYDYGRPRELHLEKALQVMKPKTGAGKVAAREMDGFTRLIEHKYFVVDRFDFGAVTEASISFDGRGCLVGLAGRATISTACGEVVLNPGQAVVAPVRGDGVIVDTDTGVSFLRCVAPDC